MKHPTAGCDNTCVCGLQLTINPCSLISSKNPYSGSSLFSGILITHRNGRFVDFKPAAMFFISFSDKNKSVPNEM
ncbi:hypothetical protein HanPSC8_Chr10g0431181 [Helianthus annuus]|nr:hypothetical protein HanPSC8_Chr10g0431181 [Helianthus annuus]